MPSQKFSLRFNESFILRSESINKYVATTGTGFQSEFYFVDDISLAERFTALAVRTWINPPYMPTADNENIEDFATYVQNGTNLHLLNTQLNFINKVPGIIRLTSHGPGTRKKGMWKDGDIFQIHVKKAYEG